MKMYAVQRVTLTLLLVATLIALFANATVSQANSFPPELEESMVTVSPDEVIAGKSTTYMVDIKNSGDADTTVMVTATLPMGVHYVADTLIAEDGVGVNVSSAEVMSDTVTWSATVGDDSMAAIHFDGMVTETATVGDMYTATVAISFMDTITSVKMMTTSEEVISTEEITTTSVVTDTEGVTSTVVMTDTMVMTDTIEVTTPVIVTSTKLVTSSEEVTSTKEITTTSVVTDTDGVTSTVVMTDTMVMTDTVVMTDTMVVSNTIIMTESAITTIEKDVVITVRNPMYYTYLPIVSNPDLPFDQPTNFRSSDISNVEGHDFKWTLNWNEVAENPAYEIQESKTADFAEYKTYASTDGEANIKHGGSNYNVYYYRVRAITAEGQDARPESAWSDTVKVIGSFYDDFNNNDGNWRIVQQDLDELDNNKNSVSVRDDYLRLKNGGEWDYLIASNVMPAPALPYRITLEMSIHEPDNLNTAGIVFGAGWDESEGDCPTGSQTELWRSCFTSYYRQTMTWFGPNSTLRFNGKNIDRHKDNEDNDGKTDSTKKWADYRDIGGLNDSGYNEYTIEVHENGTITSWVGGQFVGEVTDSRYIDQPYFGFFSSSHEYCCTEPRIKWVRVEPITE